VKGKAQPPWTDAELDILRDAYQRAGGKHPAAWALIGDRLPGRSRHGAINKAQQLGITSGNPANWGGQREPALLDPPEPLPWGDPPEPCPHCGRPVPARQIGPRRWVGTTVDGDYQCYACGTVQPVAARPAERRRRGRD
jgi:hypothetical protein